MLFAPEEVLGDEQVPDGGRWLWEELRVVTPGPRWEMSRSDVDMPRSVLSSRSAATDGELDGDFLERRRLLDCLRGLWELD